VKEYDVYLPLHHNDGRPIAPNHVARFKKVLVDEFGGLTHFPQENEGIWKFGGITFRDKVIILRVLSNDDARARKFLAEFRVELMRTLEQADILIVEREATVVT
jgi:hypothetical protein